MEDFFFIIYFCYDSFTKFFGGRNFFLVPTKMEKRREYRDLEMSTWKHDDLGRDRSRYSFSGGSCLIRREPLYSGESFRRRSVSPDRAPRRLSRQRTLKPLSPLSEADFDGVSSRGVEEKERGEMELPMDVLKEIGVKLPNRDLARLCQTNREWARVCRDDYFWRLRVQRYHPRQEAYKPAGMTWLEFYRYLEKVLEPNAFLVVATNYSLNGSGGGNVGLTWGFLVVPTETGYVIFRGEPVRRGRLLAVQVIDDPSYFKEKIQFYPQPLPESFPELLFDEELPWRSLVYLLPSDIYLVKSLAENPTPEGMKRLDDIVKYLRVIVSGEDDDEEVYIVPEEIPVDILAEEVNV